MSCLSGTAISIGDPLCMKTVLFKQILSYKANTHWFCKIVLQLELVTMVWISLLEKAVSKKKGPIINSAVIPPQTVTLNAVVFHAKSNDRMSPIDYNFMYYFLLIKRNTLHQTTKSYISTTRHLQFYKEWNWQNQSHALDPEVLISVKSQFCADKVLKCNARLGAQSSVIELHFLRLQVELVPQWIISSTASGFNVRRPLVLGITPSSVVSIF